jgi:hypothetical protein
LRSGLRVEPAEDALHAGIGIHEGIVDG